MTSVEVLYSPRPQALDIFRGRIVHADGERLVVESFGVNAGPRETSQSLELWWNEVVEIRTWDRETRVTGDWIYRQVSRLHRRSA